MKRNSLLALLVIIMSVFSLDAQVHAGPNSEDAKDIVFSA
jgi:hypothetical protein